MLQIFINELIGALVQLLLFSLIPFVVWLIFYRKKESFFKWIGISRIRAEGKRQTTVMAAVGATGLYIMLTMLAIRFLPGDITTAGSSFAGKGMAAFPAVLVYGFIRTGLSEELLFRGFLLKRISEKTGFLVGDLVQALFFGLAHGLPFAIISNDLPVGVVLTLLPGAFAFFLGWLNEKSCGGSIIPSWLLHGLVNVLTAALSL